MLSECLDKLTFGPKFSSFLSCLTELLFYLVSCSIPLLDRSDGDNRLQWSRFCLFFLILGFFFYIKEILKSPLTERACVRVVV